MIILWNAIVAFQNSAKRVAQDLRSLYVKEINSLGISFVLHLYIIICTYIIMSSIKTVKSAINPLLHE